MAAIAQDVTYAFRQLRKHLGFTLTAVLMLALGIGANAAIFTLVHAVLLKDLPVADPGSLVRLGDQMQCCVGSGTPDDGDQALFSTDTYQQLHAHTPEFQQLAAMEAGYEYRPLTARREGGQEQARSVMAEFVSGNYFTMFGLQPAAGRLMTDADDRLGAPMTAVMSYDTWVNQYARDPSIIGATIAVNTQPVTVIGIAPAGFFGDRLHVSPPELFLPLFAESLLRGTDYERDPGMRYLWMIGRLQPDTARLQLQQKLSAELRAILSPQGRYSTEQGRRDLAKQHLVLTDGSEGIQDMQRNYGSRLKLLLWISGLVLLIACANIANLLMVRGVAQKAELAVRAAMGASRRRILRQLLTESAVLALLGGAAALAVSYFGAALLVRMAFSGQAIPIDATPSFAVFGFALALSLATAVLFGVVPALLASAAQPADVLRSNSRSVSGGTSRLQRGLVATQAGLSVVLLIGAGLFARSLGNLQHADMKLNATNRYVLHFDPQTAGYTPSQVEPLYRTIVNQFHAVPGMVNVGISSYAPMEDNNTGNGIQVQGRPDENKGASEVKVTPEYFDSVGTHVVAGRGIAERDHFGAATVAVVNQAFVKTFFQPGENPIGHRFGSPGATSSGDFEIVGVVEDTAYQSVQWKNHEMYFPALTQQAPSDKESVDQDISFFASTIVLQTSRPVPDMEAIARRTLSALNPNLAVVKFQTFRGQIADQFVQERMLSRLMALFAGLALLLATVGLYGLTSYAVVRRTNEIGIRMALGAERGNVVALVMRSALLQTLTGVLVGVPVACYCVRFVRSQLYDLSAVDLAGVVGPTVVLLLAAVAAGWLPGRRAALIEPATALRSE